MTHKVASKAKPWIEPAPEGQASAHLDMAAPAEAPPASLWARIEERLAAAELVTCALTVERFGEGRWRTLAPGVRMKKLWGGRTMLIDCEPGAVVPAHRHRSFEHSLILAGDVTSDEGDYSAGDYQGMPAGSEHGAWSTRTGCRVLVQYDA